MRYLLIVFLFLVSCSNIETQKDEELAVAAELDTISNATIPESNGTQKISKQSEQIENKSKIEQKYGKQLDFCACIQFHDSLNNAAQKDLSEKQIEKLLNRWEFMENQCKELVITNYRTPEERSAHEQKVKKCLNQK